jgi:predicted transcriptional regulator of viral defense system
MHKRFAQENIRASDAAIAAIAGRQHGLVTASQLLRAGLARPAVTRRVQAGRLHRVGRAVYAVGHASLSQEARWMAAVLEAGEGAALSHLAAAKLWEIWRRRVTTIDVVSPRRSRLPYVHRTQHLDPRDVTKRNGIPVTTVARTLVDLTDILTSEQLANVIHEAAFRQRFSERAARAAIERARGAARVSWMRRSERMRPGVPARRAASRTGSSHTCVNTACPTRS